MPNETDKTPKADDSKTSESPAEKRIEQVADEAAEKAGKTEQRYDKEHGIFRDI